ncbi:MAG: M20 family metallo-hydrolase [Cytophagales bacterium]|uniref:M20 family metallo-hydrolase n=1 Tax=Cyclobacterium marinum TaxID=104 RepID=UPI0030D96C27|nr:M20 family metallo-hydrolase [Cytophagales bacterium]
MEDLAKLKLEAIELLKGLISTPSLSKAEDKTAELIAEFFFKKGIETHRKGNNIWAYNKQFDDSLPTILLNSHHDTVKPNRGYTIDPHTPLVKEGKLFGLGSNDAGGCLVSLMATFAFYYDQTIPVNLVLVASAEEEISGRGGIESVLSELPDLEVAIVGEPTLLKMAVAEKGLMVIDAVISGVAGHAAREEGTNAIYESLEDLLTIRDFKFKKESPFLGPNKVSATIITAGSQHNVVPDKCTYTLDVRVTDAYTLEEAFAELKSNLKAELTPRSLRLNSSSIKEDHPMVSTAKEMGLELYGSPTLSDQALIPFPSVKIGPGDSARSHTADEFIFVEEIKEGISLYVSLLKNYFSNTKRNTQ